MSLSATRAKEPGFLIGLALAALSFTLFAVSSALPTNDSRLFGFFPLNYLIASSGVADRPVIRSLAANTLCAVVLFIAFNRPDRIISVAIYCNCSLSRTPEIGWSFLSRNFDEAYKNDPLVARRKFVYPFTAAPRDERIRILEASYL